MIRNAGSTWLQWLPLCGIALAAALTSPGCHLVTKACHAIPASRLDPHLFGTCRDAEVPILMSALGQTKPEAHRVGAGDTLAVYVFGQIPASTVENTPIVQQQMALNQRYYAPHGNIERPAFGLPFTVYPDGSMDFPVIGRLKVEGMTLQEIVSMITQKYRETGQLVEGRERISVSLLTARVKRVVVIRQDTPNPAVALTPPGVVDQIHRGSGEVIDLRIYENDVLHALSSTGGLPGTDAAREVYVMRNSAIAGQQLDPTRIDALVNSYEQGHLPGPAMIRIPLVSYANDPLPFRPEDVVLEEGDVLFVPQRHEYFYTGGLLGGAKIPMPRDEDLDVLEAIALATNSTGGPLGASGLALFNGRPGHMIKPSRVVILRKMPDGTQLPIRVDLARAVEDPKERINILPDDLVMMHFKPSEAAINGVVNFISFNFLFDPHEL